MNILQACYVGSKVGLRACVFLCMIMNIYYIYFISFTNQFDCSQVGAHQDTVVMIGDLFAQICMYIHNTYIYVMSLYERSYWNFGGL